MITSLLIGTITGIVLALPPGPVAITAIKTSLFKSEKEGYEVAIGNAVMDFVFFLIAVFAASAAVEVIKAFSKDYPVLVLLFQCLIVGAMIVFGIMNLRRNHGPVDYDRPKAYDNRLFSMFKTKGPIILGAAVAFGNLANPTFGPTLGFVAHWVNQLSFMEPNPVNNLMLALGFGLGNFLWLSALVRIVIKYKHKFSDNFIRRVRQFAGVTFIGFGTVIGYRVLVITKWSEIVRLLFAF